MSGIGLWCRCGSACVGLAVPPEQAKRLTEIWWSLHKGDGHGSTDAKTAYRARRRNEAELVRRERERT